MVENGVRADFTISDFITTCSTPNESTLSTYRKRLTTCERLHGRPLCKATPRTLGDLKAKLREKRSGRSYAKDLQAFYRRMGREDLAALCILKQRVRKLDRADLLSLDEVNRILAAAKMLRDRAVVATLWGSGQRVGAVLALRLRDLTEMDAEHGGPGIRVFFAKVKVDGRQHVGYLLDEDGGEHLRSWLKAYSFRRTPDAPAFPAHEGVALSPDTFRDILRGLARRAGIAKAIHPHLLRHSRATNLLLMGVPGHSVKELLGWHPASSVLERTYAHLVSTDARDDLLRAHGHPVTRSVDVGKLAAVEGDLKPVVPLLEGRVRGPSTADEVAALRTQVETLQKGFATLISQLATDRGLPVGSRVDAAIDERTGAVRFTTQKRA